MSSVPLAALAVNTQPPDPLSQYAKVVQLKSLLGQQALQPGQMQEQQQKIQSNALELQQQQLALKDKQGVDKALLDSGGSLAKLKQNISDPQYGISAQGQFGFQQKMQELAKAGADADDAQIKAHKDANAQISSILQPVIDAPPEDQPARYALAMNQLHRDPTLAKYAQDAPPQFPGAAQLKIHLNTLKTTEELLAQQKQNNEAPGQIAKSQQEQQEAALGPAGRAAMTSPTLQSQNDWLKKHPGMGPSDYEIAMKKVAPQFQFNLQSGMLTPEAKAMAAQNYAQTGQLPAGMRSPAMASGILNQAASGGAAPNVAANKANYQADAASLKSLQSNMDQVTAFENTAGKNLDQFLSTAKNVIDSGSPLINQPLRSVASKVAGSPNQAAFEAARTTALTEIAKVLNSSKASGVLSDSARGEVSQLIGKDATLAQIYSAANILKNDMGNRHQSYQDKINEIKGRLGGQGQQQGGNGMTRIKASDGSLHDVPTANLDKARQIDPNLQVVQ
jgi:hypothetical protein